MKRQTSLLTISRQANSTNLEISRKESEIVYNKIHRQTYTNHLKFVLLMERLRCVILTLSSRWEIFVCDRLKGTISSYHSTFHSIVSSFDFGHIHEPRTATNQCTTWENQLRNALEEKRMTPLCVHHEVSTCPAVGLLLCLPISGYVKAKSDAVFDHYMRSLQLLLTLA